MFRPWTGGGEGGRRRRRRWKQNRGGGGGGGEGDEEINEKIFFGRVKRLEKGEEAEMAKEEGRPAQEMCAV